MFKIRTFRYLPLIFVILLLLFSFSVGSAQDTPQRGGNAVVALVQEPGVMNPFFTTQSGADLALFFVQEPLFRPDASGEYQPVLAAEIPTLENGGLSEDFLTVTYRLNEGITWSDGEPFTAEDIVFTFDVFKNPESTPQLDSAYDLIESVTAVDDLTVEVKMSAINPGYLELFKSILPAHRFDTTAITNEHELARLPLGTGPFVFEEWRTGDQITLVRNDNYWMNPELPYLDGITIRITPEKEVAVASFVEGEYDTMFFFVTGDLATLTDAQNSGAPIEVALQETPSWVEWLWLNHSDNGDLSTPHPVLGDPAIREAIDLGLDRQVVIDEVLGGFGYLEGSFLYSGWASVDIPHTEYNPERAREVLDEAGWVVGDDGIRVKDGVRASVRYQTIAGDLVRELYQQVVQQNMRDIGIEFIIENVPSNTMFGGYADGGSLATGNYDIMMSRDGYYIDPINWTAVFNTDSIPTEEDPNGFTYSHWSNAEFDELTQTAATTLDQATREDLYTQAATLFAAERVALPLYSSAWGWAWNSRLGGVDINYWDGMWPSAAEWYIQE